MKSRNVVLHSMALGLLLGAGGVGATIVLNSGTINMFRDIRGVNDVGVGGVGGGDVWQFGANISGGSGGTFITATSPNGGFTTSGSPCSPLTVSPSFCAGATTYNTNRIGQWTLNFSRPGETPLHVAAPTTATTTSKVPFPTNVTISGSGSTPVISWQLPNGYSPDGFRVQIFDKAKVLQNGVSDIIYSTTVASNATSFNFAGKPVNLQVGHQYSINFQVIDTRDGLPFAGNNAQINVRSNSFFSFTPAPPGTGGPPQVYIPQVAPDTNPNDNLGPTFIFNVTQVGPSSITFIDPVVATGYNYAIAPGDPNFASVLLPSVGDNLFDLFYDLGGGLIHQVLAAGDQFFFPQGGVPTFSVQGIETSAGLGPNDASAFITGLTFAGNGEFNGTMTSILTDVASVPEPATILLFGAALAGLGWRRTRRISGRVPG